MDGRQCSSPSIRSLRDRSDPSMHEACGLALGMLGWWKRPSSVLPSAARSAEYRGICRLTICELGGTLVISIKRSEEHTSELQSLMRISYAVFCLKKKKKQTTEYKKERQQQIV